ncbi:hypothetical protein [Pannonibacter sp. SL95]|uniref:hypothetical protein n=1 Tax=Pannonibacter sp. SL95 TaxID=2995153 RepID=UPI0022748B4B|nr:hypothetical protein [Pannonibacter sp. SL95]MCY1705510.1 hypothetical protein [Pannonibacter sp. SL95]
MTTKCFVVEVTRQVTVELDTSRFTKELMEEFNAVITDFGTDEDAYEAHARHIAWFAANVSEVSPDDFAEGYGVLKDAGITVKVHSEPDVEIVGGGGSA